MWQLNALRFVELYDLAVQRNIQSGRRDRDLNEIRVWSLVGYYFAGTDDPVLRSRFHPRTALNLVLTVCRGRGHAKSYQHQGGGKRRAVNADPHEPLAKTNSSPPREQQPRGTWWRPRGYQALAFSRSRLAGGRVIFGNARFSDSRPWAGTLTQRHGRLILKCKESSHCPNETPTSKGLGGCRYTDSSAP